MSESTAIAIRPQASLPAKIAYAQELANSGLLPAQYRRQPANVLYALEYGEMLGLSAMAAITGVHVIEGKPSASAGLISALVRRAGHKLRVTGDTKSATCTIVRSDDPDYEFKVTWTMRRNSDDNPSAEEAGLLGKQVWKNFGASMLKARAITQCARDACEEALFGLHYTPEELGAEVDEEGIVLGEIVEEDTPVVPHMAPQGPPRDTEWLDAAMRRARGESEDGDLDGERCRALWRESAAKANAGEIAKADAAGVQAILKTRLEALAAEAESPAVEAAETVEADVVDAEIVEVVPPMEEDEFTLGFLGRLAEAPDESLGEMQVEATKALAAGVIAPATLSQLLADVGRRRTDLRKVAA